MSGVLEIGFSLVVILNKICVVGIAAWVVWFMQTIMLDPRWVAKLPILDSFIFRVALSLIGGGFGLDAFALYTPALSEVVMNFGIVALMFMFRKYYKKAKTPEGLFRALMGEGAKK